VVDETPVVGRRPNEVGTPPLTSPESVIGRNALRCDPLDAGSAAEEEDRKLSDTTLDLDSAAERPPPSPAAVYELVEKSAPTENVSVYVKLAIVAGTVRLAGPEEPESGDAVFVGASIRDPSAPRKGRPPPRWSSTAEDAEPQSPL